ncbi:cell division protein FtsA [Jiella sp. MQZ9-1]|uniref:Cell division protein FtsA n=1 Tax=Jiella flava TaxID=2816857 RepID=A0A939FYF2_9HYPH|nr:cell division protein FtsA [Jiella flava]MBO0663840.1 cell division protein FtsA [Jiella flava]MCD2472413.1 cell division protein FtsA [Jiella flava]
MSLLSLGKSDLPRVKGLSARRSRVISVLDVGSEKISCLIARLRPRVAGEMLPDRTHTIEVIGVGHHRSRGIKSGAVVDIAAAEQAIRQCVDAAERMAGLSVESLIVSVTAGRLKSMRRRASTEVVGEVSQADLSRVIESAAKIPVDDGRVALHSTVYDIQLDDELGLEHPVGMTGHALSANLHVLTAEIAALRNLEAAINRAQLVVEAFVATPYASALSTMVEDEAAMGSACIDMGSGATTIAIFQNGRFVYADQIAIGGANVTMDLARGLSISPADAERIKVMHGSTLAELLDDTGEPLAVAPLGESGEASPIQVKRSLVTKIIRPRVEETFELVRDRLNASGLGHVIGKRVILTGGASQLAGLAETARTVLQRNVRLGRPLGVTGLNPSSKGPGFSTSVGLLIYPQVAHREYVSERSSAVKVFEKAMEGGRVGSWLRRSL